MTYTDEDLKREFPEREIKCRYCKKKFKTRFDQKHCSLKCFKKETQVRQKSQKKRYVKSARNLVGADAIIIKGTGRRKN